MLPRVTFGRQAEANEVPWARGRQVDRIYAHATFTLNLPASEDYGHLALYIVKVLDEEIDGDEFPEADLEGAEGIVMISRGRR